MNLDDLIKLAGLSKSADTPVQEQPQDSHDGMKTLIALVTPEQLNQLQSEADLEEEGYQNSGDHYSGEPEDYKGPLGSPADLSLRRYLGANGEHVTVDETKVYEDHKVEDITEAFAQYKTAQNQVVTEAHACGCDDSCACGGNCGPDCNCHSGCSATNESVNEGVMKQAATEIEEWAEKYNEKTGVNGDELANGWLQAMLNSGIMSDSYDQDEYIAFNEKYGYEDDMEWEEDDAMDKFYAESPITRGMHDEANAIMKKYNIDENDFNNILGYFGSKQESVVDEADIDENAFNQAAAAAARAGKDTFEFGGKTHKTTMKKDVAHKLDDDVQMLRKLAGL
jgi:hypothetical protein